MSDTASSGQCHHKIATAVADIVGRVGVDTTAAFTTRAHTNNEVCIADQAAISPSSRAVASVMQEINVLCQAVPAALSAKLANCFFHRYFFAYVMGVVMRQQPQQYSQYLIHQWRQCRQCILPASNESNLLM
mmetsp:Transcript_98536/g.190288  ORF Transcript_98536/g.190288 Transcript_98536/m.190288 type:complete len:132 (+) Transcript_98536:385-780(+)